MDNFFCMEFIILCICTVYTSWMGFKSKCTNFHSDKLGQFLHSKILWHYFCAIFLKLIQICLIVTLFHIQTSPDGTLLQSVCT